MAFVEYTKIPILKNELDNININNFTTTATVIVGSSNKENQNNNTINTSNGTMNTCGVENIQNNYSECDGNGMKSVHIINDEIIHTTTMDLQNVHQQKKKYCIIEIDI